MIFDMLSTILNPQLASFNVFLVAKNVSHQKENNFSIYNELLERFSQDFQVKKLQVL